MCHAHDWRNITSDAEFKRFAKALGIRILSPDRFQSPYVESISVDNWERLTSSSVEEIVASPELEKVFFLRQGEYWAEICAQYFDDPSELSYPDWKIVNERVHKLDPKFEPRRAKEVREALIHTPKKG